jgi:DNA-binding IclR family transcriptional regulator
LNAELEKVRKAGYAVIDNELEDGLVAVAAPVFNHDGKVVAAISISGPDARISRDQLNKFGELIIKELKKQNINNGKVGAA